MSMPRRWLEHDGPPEFQRLLQAARHEPLPRRAMERVVLTVSTTSLLGTIAGGALGATAKAATASLGWALAKWGAAAVLGLGLATTTAATVHHFKVTSARSVANATPQTTVPPTHLVALPARAQTSERSNGREHSLLPRSPPPNIAVETGASKEPAPERAIDERNSDVEPRVHVGPKRVVVAPIQPQVRPVSDAQLLEELRWIDRSRAALRAGDPRGALELLDDYPRHCPAQRLLPEALLLRAQAASRAGNHAAAQRAADEIEARYPNLPHVQKAKEAVGAGQGMGGE